MIVNVEQEYDIDFDTVIQQFPSSTSAMIDEGWDADDIIRALVLEYGAESVLGQPDVAYISVLGG